jgi:hypothetical protein
VWPGTFSRLTAVVVHGTGSSCSGWLEP